jgi:hypothetical protein
VELLPRSRPERPGAWPFRAADAVHSCCQGRHFATRERLPRNRMTEISQPQSAQRELLVKPRRTGPRQPDHGPSPGSRTATMEPTVTVRAARSHCSRNPDFAHPVLMIIRNCSLVSNAVLLALRMIMSNRARVGTDSRVRRQLPRATRSLQPRRRSPLRVSARRRMGLYSVAHFPLPASASGCGRGTALYSSAALRAFPRAPRTAACPGPHALRRTPLDCRCLFRALCLLSAEWQEIPATAAACSGR